MRLGHSGTARMRYVSRSHGDFTSTCSSLKHGDQRRDIGYVEALHLALEFGGLEELIYIANIDSLRRIQDRINFCFVVVVYGQDFISNHRGDARF